jgi:colanic acid biosynthesis glycosyl transferase WcaI
LEKILKKKLNRLLVVTQYFWPENFRINDLVSELAERGYEITVLTGYPNYPSGIFFSEFCARPEFFSNFKGIKVVRVPIFPRGKSKLSLILNYFSFAISASLLGLWKLRSFKFDVIFTYQTSPVTVGIPDLIFKKIRKIPMMLWVLD